MKTILTESDIKCLVRTILKEINVRDTEDEGTPDSIISLAKHIEFIFSKKGLLDSVTIETIGKLVAIKITNNDYISNIIGLANIIIKNSNGKIKAVGNIETNAEDYNAIYLSVWSENEMRAFKYGSNYNIDVDKSTPPIGKNRIGNY